MNKASILLNKCGKMSIAQLNREYEKAKWQKLVLWEALIEATDKNYISPLR